MLSRYLPIFVVLSLIAEVLGTVGGFGSSVFFVPIANFFFDFQSVLGITALFHLSSNITKIAFFKKGLDKKLIVSLGVPAVVFVLIGAFLSKYFNPIILTYILGFFLISLSLLFLIFKQIKVSPKTKNAFLGLAPVFEDHPSLQPLEGTEVNSIRKLIGGKTLSRAEANREAFFRDAPKAGIVHLCTHAFIQEQPFNAWFELADGPVNMAELDTMNLNLDMIVLSACETGTGALERGEGIMSLARIFSYLGCQSIVSSLWKVNNQSTAEIMESFYGHLARKETKDLAIRQAKLDYFRSENIDHGNAHPYFWAGFLQSGSRNELPEMARSWMASVLSPGVFFSSIALLAIYFFWRNKWAS